MRRRDFIKVVAGSVMTWPLAAHAQQVEQMRRIGVLMGYAESDRTARSEVAAFRSGLAKLGWTEGSNLRIELRWGNADPDTIRTLAKELIALRPDVILSQTTLVTGALARETRTIPIVFVNVSDPIASGFAARLAGFDLLLGAVTLGAAGDVDERGRESPQVTQRRRSCRHSFVF